jgi:hypothetical protein
LVDCEQSRGGLTLWCRRSNPTACRRLATRGRGGRPRAVEGDHGVSSEQAAWCALTSPRRPHLRHRLAPRAHPGPRAHAVSTQLRRRGVGQRAAPSLLLGVVLPEAVPRADGQARGVRVPRRLRHRSPHPQNGSAPPAPLSVSHHETEREKPGQSRVRWVQWRHMQSHRAQGHSRRYGRSELLSGF